MNRILAPIVLATSVPGLAACSVAGVPIVQSTGEGIPPSASITIAEPREGSSYEAELSSALAAALQKRSFTVSDNGSYYLQYGAALRPSSIGVLSAGEDTEVKTVSDDRKKLLLDNCEAQRMRITVTVLDRASGAAVHNSTVDVDDCGFSESQAAGMASEIAGTLTRG